MRQLTQRDDDQGKAIRWLLGQLTAMKDQQKQLFQWQQRARQRRPSLIQH